MEETTAYTHTFNARAEGAVRIVKEHMLTPHPSESHPILLSPCVDHRITGHIDTQHTHTHKCTHRGYISQAARATWYPHGVMMLL